MRSTDNVHTQRIGINQIIAEVATICRRKHLFVCLLRIICHVICIHIVNTRTNQRMIQLIHQPYNLVCLCIGMVFNGNLHSVLLNQRNGCLEFVIANQHLLHNIRMHFTAKQIFRTNNVQAEFYQLCIQIMTNAQRFFYSTIYTGIAACIERGIEFQEQPAFLCICRHLVQIFCAERVILCGCQQIHLCNL